MSKNTRESIISQCHYANSNHGCFSDDQAAYETFAHGGDDDPYYDILYKRVGVEAIRSAQEYIPLYPTPVPLPGFMLEAIDTLENGSHMYTVSTREEGELARLSTIADFAKPNDSVSGMTTRIATCAYQCGKHGAGNCPIFNNFS